MDAPRCPRCDTAAPEIVPGQPLCDTCWEAIPSRVRRAVARLKVSRQVLFATGQLEVAPAARKNRPRRGGTAPEPPTPPTSS
ncbi:MAG: hypothetical protein QOK36_3975 [Gaiellales bacterium]|nr:hypothetical protein [Gaiellales bacterium]